MYRKITYSEGYTLLREVGCDWLVSSFTAFVWVLRGDEIYVEKEKL
jgi:hypothetical protein